MKVNCCIFGWISKWKDHLKRKTCVQGSYYNEKTTWRGRPVFKGLTIIGTISESNLLTYFSIFIFYDNLSALNWLLVAVMLLIIIKLWHDKSRNKSRFHTISVSFVCFPTRSWVVEKRLFRKISHIDKYPWKCFPPILSLLWELIVSLLMNLWW